jgi:hypothetical protein
LRTFSASGAGRIKEFGQSGESARVAAIRTVLAIIRWPGQDLRASAVNTAA